MSPVGGGAFREIVERVTTEPDCRRWPDFKVNSPATDEWQLEDAAISDSMLSDTTIRRGQTRCVCMTLSPPNSCGRFCRSQLKAIASRLCKNRPPRHWDSNRLQSICIFGRREVSKSTIAQSRQAHSVQRDSRQTPSEAPARLCWPQSPAHTEKPNRCHKALRQSQPNTR